MTILPVRLWPAALTALGLAAAGLAFQSPAKPKSQAKNPGWTLVVSGDTDGYLSPCGCTSPMTGGIRRRGTAVRDIARHSRVVLIDTGELGGEPGRQGEMKAETMAQSLTNLDAAAINVTAKDARLGKGSLMSVARLAEGRVVSSSLPNGAVEGVRSTVERGPFVIAGISDGIGESLAAPSVPDSVAVESLLRTAKEKRGAAVLMLDGSRAEAVAMAKRYPALRAIVYHLNGWPPDRPEHVGKVWLLTPGERGKSVVSVRFDGRSFDGYSVKRLGPQFLDDATIQRYYSAYLRRVDRANLLEQIPRVPSPAFAGSASCAACHVTASHVWEKSGHSHALATLEKQGHGRDPDCVSCHVTGLTSERGFRSRVETPNLAFVGCESCHGPAAAHVADPKGNRLAHLGQAVCTTCHTPDQSPGFNFVSYWQKISHK
ncbi:cytochrome c family protein [Fimbriimonas ginsengisoli]|uniref:5'-nucleotidase/2' 3'-cyclic phosphodiesterase-like esterase n=1 Tax=Fimbriimonas ginsengisoli Gsoil 348 TaxID=661478 RepID=A0A068NLG5_FIMGI|nr:cytochrome c family protein [Fimbriimonas ginsengisoli]AIE84262.1 5'-nucleotidase/2' 3'-cyclic phosphodiesterase-like esterase [Fimbriimonas ginsengisoli Gsoil 348]